MTALVVLNSIAAIVVVAGLAAAMRFGYVAAGGGFELADRRFELRRSAGEERPPAERRAA